MHDLAIKKSDPIVIGLAVFALFFGAGSLLFPPYLGLTSGTQWSIGFLCFYAIDMVLAFVTVIAMVRRSGSMNDITGILGKIPATIINTAVLVCVGPLFIVPRSSATTFEMAMVPIVPDFNPIIFSIIFFGVAWFLAIKRSRLVDIVGRLLTPAMLIAIIVLVYVGVMYPMGEIAQPISTTVVKDGILAGYQAMDVLGALTVGIVVMGACIDRGYTDKKQLVKIASKACVVAGGLLFLVYAGLTYLGAAASSVVDINSVNQASLIVVITTELLSSHGMTILGILVALASLTTAVGVSSAVATYFEELFNHKFSYNIIVTIIIVFSTVVSNFGLSAIISLAGPVLSIMYPTIITLVILSFYREKIKNVNVYKGAAICSIAIGFLVVLTSYGVDLPFIKMLPLVEYGFEWIIPTVIGGILGSFIKSNDIEVPQGI